jgi:AGZA family xanthine/uracil permease-like MFS transporter
MRDGDDQRPGTRAPRKTVATPAGLAAERAGPTPQGSRLAYRWYAPGDINAFFGLMLDNVVNLALLGAILVGAFGFPADLVYTRMFPGTALGVLVGDAIYTWLAFRLAKKTGRSDVTAMPLGLDSPSTLGMALAVLGPAFIAAKSRMADADAAIVAWQVGMATMVVIGVFKTIMAFFGEALRRAIPAPGILGAIAGVGLALLGTLQLANTFGEPVVGMISLGIIVYGLVAKLRLPFRAPEVLASVVVGAVVFYSLGAAGLLTQPVALPALEFPLGFPTPSLGFVAGLGEALTTYLPLALPFAILTIVGGIINTESARVAGDHYETRDILLTEAASTLVAGVCGGVAQTTPYIGHPAYKAMGGRAAYTLATGIFVGAGGMLGYIAFLADALPLPALAPILVFIAIEMTTQSFTSMPRKHFAAVTIAALPSLAYLVLIFLSQVHGGALLGAAIDPAAALQASGLTNPAFVRLCGVVVMLANGFIITAMLWGGAATHLIDRNTRAAAALLACGAVLSLVGVMHSILPTGGLYWPWRAGSLMPYHWAAAYAVVAVALVAAARVAKKVEADDASEGE